MAFKFNRHPAPPDIICQENGNEVATKSWVHSIVDKILMSLSSLKSQTIDVSGQITSNSILSNDIKTDKLVSNGITLIDEKGNPAHISIVNGEVKVTYDFKNVFLYPSTGVVVKEFIYDSSKSIFENFDGLSKKEIYDRFKPLSDTDSIIANGMICHRICSSDGEEQLVDKTLLVTCNQSKYIKSICICDKNFNKIDEIYINRPTRNLTINMPILVNDGGDVIIDVIPDRCECHTHHTHICTPSPFPSVISPYPLDPSIFDDEPPESNCSCREDSEYDDSSDIQQIEQDEENNVKWGNYQTEKYDNILIYRNSFNKNELQFIIVETQNA